MMAIVPKETTMGEPQPSITDPIDEIIARLNRLRIQRDAALAALQSMTEEV